MRLGCSNVSSFSNETLSHWALSVARFSYCVKTECSYTMRTPWRRTCTRRGTIVTHWRENTTLHTSSLAYREKVASIWET